jgi:hypothetical protein
VTAFLLMHNTMRGSIVGDWGGWDHDDKDDHKWGWGWGGWKHDDKDDHKWGWGWGWGGWKHDDKD